MKRRIRNRLRALRTALTIPFAPMEGAEDPPATDPPATDPPATDPPAESKLLNEEQVNRIVQERLARDRRERPSDEEIATLRENAKKWEDAEAANASELDKATKRAEEAEAKADKATTAAHKALRRAAIVAAATKEGADPDIVHALLADKGFKHGETEIAVGDDGEVAGATDAVKALVEEKKLGEGAPPPPGDGGARTPAPTKDLDEQIKEAQAKGDAREVIRLNNQKLFLLKQKQDAA